MPRRSKKATGVIADLACKASRLPSLPVVKQTHEDIFLRRLHFDIAQFEPLVVPTPQEKCVRLQVYNLLAAVLRKRFRDCQVEVYGSAAQGLALHSSDTDVAVLIPGKTGPGVLFQIASKLESVGLVVPGHTRVRHRARIPIVSVQTKPEFGSLRFDIVVNHDDGMKVTPIVHDYLDKMPAVRPLLLILKVFLCQRNLNSAATGGPSSYVLTCMVIHFLQVNPNGLHPLRIEDHMRTESLGYLLLDFLKYYGSEFPYETDYISVKAKKRLPKTSAPWISQNCYPHLCVECLTNEEANIARAINKTKALKAALWDGHTQLRKLMEASDPGTVPEEGAPSEGSSFENTGSSGVSYLENIVTITQQDRERKLNLNDMAVNIQKFKTENWTELIKPRVQPPPRRAVERGPEGIPSRVAKKVDIMRIEQQNRTCFQGSPRSTAVAPRTTTAPQCAVINRGHRSSGGCSAGKGNITHRRS
ncbi:hypothetical protein EDD17DRAFT_1565717 [Pisolithus thermaeus]|nr:hypothetical protein EDD17DRAFT_1565717 [Pisolithus thermaeus]